MIEVLAVTLTGTALGSAAAVWALTASWRAALRVLLELLTAAGLIRLAAVQGWADIAGVAAIVTIRHVLSVVLLGPASRPPAGRGPSSPVSGCW